MAIALEFYKASETTPANFTGAYSTFLTCTANRTGKAGSKNFFIIAHISTTVDNVGTLGKVRLQVDSTDYGECADGLTHSDVSPHGFTYNFVKRLSLDNSSHTITLDCGRISGDDNFQAQNASIAVLEESANAEYNDSVTETGSIGTGWTDYLQLQFTAAASENYLLIWSCERMTEDESDGGVGGVQFIETQEALGEYASEAAGFLVGDANDGLYHTAGATCFAALTDNTEYTFKIQMNGRYSSDQVLCRKGAIIAIPFSDFENVYSASQTEKTFHKTAQSDTDVVIASQACNAADHLVICGQECSNEGIYNNGFTHLISAGPVDFPLYNFDDRDEDSGQYYLNFAVHGVTLAADDYDFEIEGDADSDSDSTEGCVNEAYLIVAEIPAVVAALSISVSDTTTLTESLD